MIVTLSMLLRYYHIVRTSTVTSCILAASYKCCFAVEESGSRFGVTTRNIRIVSTIQSYLFCRALHSSNYSCQLKPNKNCNNTHVINPNTSKKTKSDGIHRASVPPALLLLLLLLLKLSKSPRPLSAHPWLNLRPL